MPLFAPLSQSERRALRDTRAAAVPQQLAALLQQHHTRVIDLFRALDKNADGEVTRDELDSALTSLGVRATREELNELFEKLDPDGSGGIVFRELQVRAGLRPERRRARMRQCGEAARPPAARRRSRRVLRLHACVTHAVTHRRHSAAPILHATAFLV